MALDEDQVSVDGFMLGAGTPYSLVNFNPYARNARADQGAARAWGDGSWSGAEWAEQTAVPMTIHTKATDADTWVVAHQALLAAFAPRSTDVQLRWRFAGTEWVMFGRPRMVDPDVHLIRRGTSVASAAFVALDPRIYSADVHEVQLGLPSTSGGLTAPVTAPVTVDATVTAGRATITNAGTKAVGLQVRVDGPVVEPRVSLLTGAGTAIVRVWLTLTAGQWLEIDTATRTVYLNGTASRRGVTTAEGTGWPVLPAGAAELAFNSATFDPAAQLTASWRDAWH